MWGIPGGLENERLNLEEEKTNPGKVCILFVRFSTTSVG